MSYSDDYEGFIPFLKWLWRYRKEAKFSACTLEKGYRYWGDGYVYYDGPHYAWGFWFFHIYFYEKHWDSFANKKD